MTEKKHVIFRIIPYIVVQYRISGKGGSVNCYVLQLFEEVWWGGGGGCDLVPTMPGCVCSKVKDMGPFLASRE